MNQKLRKQTGIIAIVLVVSMLLTGTYAWQSFNQGAFNVAWFDAHNYGGRIHDHFGTECEPTDVPDAGCERNKDVFAENFGTNDVFVRIRLREFLAIDGRPVILGMDINNPSGWPTYFSEPLRVHTPLSASNIERLHTDYGIRWTLGQANDEYMYFMPTHNQARYRADFIDPSVPEPFNHRNAFTMTETSGAGVDQIANELYNATINHARDFLTYGVQTAAGGNGSHNYWAPGADGVPRTLNADLITTYVHPNGDVELIVIGAYDSDGNLLNDNTHTAQRQLVPSVNLLVDDGDIDALFYHYTGENIADFRGVMTIASWNGLGRPIGNFWILDNTDGWFYWNGYLPARAATSLLLDAIYLPNRGNQSWEHVIFVEGDFFSTQTLENELFQISQDALAIFAGLVTSPQTPVPPTIDPEDEAENDDDDESEPPTDESDELNEDELGNSELPE